MFKKKKKGKTIKFRIKCSDYGIVLLLNFIKDSISTIKNEISSTLDEDLLKDLIKEKYVLMDIAHQFGITIYDEEYENKKSLPLELKEVLKKNRDNYKLNNLNETKDTINCPELSEEAHGVQVQKNELSDNSKVNDEEVF